MLKCHEVSGLVSTDTVQGMGFMKRLEYRMHLFMCVHCRRYVQQIASIGLGAREWAAGCEAEPDQLRRMQDNVRRELEG